MNKGDLVTGIDRTYERSIYKIIDIEEGRCLVEFVSFRGVTKKQWMEQDSSYSEKDFIRWRSLAEFRPAERMEVLRSSTKAHLHLLYLIRKLRSERHLLGHRHLINDNF